jgi:hypothetical protein
MPMLGNVAGALPARRAARVDPVVALRGGEGVPGFGCRLPAVP